MHSGFEHTAQYLNLPPGNYTFKVKAANSDGVWNDTPTVFHIRIRPPWWATWWAWLGYALLLGGVAWWLYRFQLRRKLEHAENERLKDLDTLKTRLYTNITHEFRTPLTVILGMAEQAGQYFSNRSEEAFKQSLEMVRRNGQHLLQLINQLLDLAKLESGQMRLNPVHGDVVAFVRYLVESFHSYSGYKNVQVHFEAWPATWEMPHDREKVQAIVANLLSNAIKFTPAEGQIFVKIRRVEQAAAPALELTVRDTGVGIPEEKIKHIFERFYQVDNSATRSGEGTGIGLALVRELVKLLRGHIEVESRPGEGSTFVVTLPVLDWAVANVEATTDLPTPPVFVHPGHTQPSSSGADAHKPLVLLVEDNADVRHYLVQCLHEVYQIVEAHDGLAGIEQALDRVPDLVVSDVMMPGRDGFEVCDTLKNDDRTSHIPVVLLTARAAAEDRIAGLRRGADAYLTKPFHREELLLVLGNLIESRRRLQARYSRGLPDSDSETTDEVAVVEDAFLQKLRGIVETHLSDAEFDMAQLSREVAMSHSQIFRKLKALTGRSPSAFIRSVRLRRAQELLRTTSLTAAEIAYETGFTSPAYFSTVFLEEFGKTPGESR